MLKSQDKILINLLASHRWHNSADTGGDAGCRQSSVLAPHGGNVDSGSRLEERTVARDILDDGGFRRNKNFLFSVFVFKRQELPLNLLYRDLFHFIDIGVGHR